MPGLIDMHVHMENEYNPKRYMDQFTANEADVAFKSVNYAEITLMAGFTTVRDLGGTGVNIALRNAFSTRLLVQDFTAGKQLPYRRSCRSNQRKEKTLMGDPGPEQGVINGPDEARKGASALQNGADNIKSTTGGV